MTKLFLTSLVVAASLQAGVLEDAINNPIDTSNEGYQVGTTQSATGKYTMNEAGLILQQALNTSNVAGNEISASNAKTTSIHNQADKVLEEAYNSDYDYSNEGYEQSASCTLKHTIALID